MRSLFLMCFFEFSHDSLWYTIFLHWHVRGWDCQVMWYLCFQFKETFILLSILPPSNLHPPDHCSRVPSPTYSLRYLWFVVFFLMMSILSSRRSYLFWALTCSSVTLTNMKGIFMCLKKNVRSIDLLRLASWTSPCFEFFFHYLLQDMSWVRCPYSPTGLWISSAHKPWI